MSSYSKSRAAGVAIIVTAIEDIGLIIWLAMLRASMAVMALAIAGGTLFLFLIVEHSIMQRAENPAFTGRVFGRIFGFTVLEVINWGIWLTLLSDTSTPLLSRNSLIASAYFFVGFYIEHQITENVISNQPYLRFRNANRVIALGVILETLSEGVGARLWVFYGGMTVAYGISAGIVLLVVGSLVEHSIQYVVGRQPVESETIKLQST